MEVLTYYIEDGRRSRSRQLQDKQLLYHLDHNTHLGFSKVLLMVAFCVVEPGASIISVVIVP